MRHNLLIFLGFFWSYTLLASPLSLPLALQEALQENLQLKTSRLTPLITDSLINKEATPPSPMIGWMREKGNSFWTLSQEFAFPTKYMLEAQKQKLKRDMEQEGLLDQQWKIRKQLIVNYYSYSTAQKLYSLLTTQQKILQEINQLILAKRATGAISQQEEIRFYLEQSQLESEKILQDQTVQEKRVALQLILKREINSQIELMNDLPIPQIMISKISSSSLQSSQLSKILDLRLQMAQTERKKVQQLFWPDFKISYIQTFPNQMMKEKRIGIEMSIPLWFWSAKGEYQSAHLEEQSQKYQIEAEQRELQGKWEELKIKLLHYQKLVTLYNDSLVPKSESLYNITMINYRSGKKSSLLEVIESMRNLIQQKMVFYQYLNQYIEVTVQLEEILSQSISSLPFSEVN